MQIKNRVQNSYIQCITIGCYRFPLKFETIVGKTSKLKYKNILILIYIHS